MAQADGSIRIEAIVSDEKAKKKLDQLNAKLRRQTESVDKQAAAVERLKEKYAELTADNAEPKGTKKLADELKKAEAEAEKLDQEYQKLSGYADISKAANGAVDTQTQASLILWHKNWQRPTQKQTV